MNKIKRTALVVGAGPGGSTAAYYLAKNGVDVLFVDKETWPRDKICGGVYVPALYPMLKEMGVEYVVIGHSERRQYFGETDDTVRDRTRAALDNGLKVILCVGETLEQREKNITFETIAIQTKIALTGVSEAELENVIIAYEPVWAIGTGKTATDEQANEVNHFIRTLIADLYSKEAADKFVVQYGGSMNAGNAEGLVAQEDIDGGLIGGASLKPADFAKIVEAASK